MNKKFNDNKNYGYKMCECHSEGPCKKHENMHELNDYGCFQMKYFGQYIEDENKPIWRIDKYKHPYKNDKWNTN